MSEHENGGPTGNQVPYNFRVGHDAGKRAEDIALCLLLTADDVLAFDRPELKASRRTPDWHLELADGRRIALEVTHRRSNWHYERFKGGWTATSSKLVDPGGLGDFHRTVSRKMRAKHERGQFTDPNREAWLAIQLDDDAGTDLEMLLQEPSPTIAEVLGRAVESVREDAASFGFSEVWCFCESMRGPGSTLVLRMPINQDQWSIWQQRSQFCWYPPWDREPGIGTKWPMSPPDRHTGTWP